MFCWSEAIRFSKYACAPVDWCKCSTFKAVIPRKYKVLMKLESAGFILLNQAVCITALSLYCGFSQLAR